MQIAVRLFATLQKFAPLSARDGCFTIKLTPGATVAALLKACHLSEKSVTVVMVNGIVSPGETILSEADEVSIFPPLAGG